MMPGVFTQKLYAKDNLPYRCPKCGDNTTFPTLVLLRHHFEIDHAYATPYSRRAASTLGGSTSRVTPLRDSLSGDLSRDAQRLERKLEIAKDLERKNKQSRLEASQRGDGRDQSSISPVADSTLHTFHLDGSERFGTANSTMNAGSALHTPRSNNDTLSLTTKTVNDHQYLIDRLKEQLQFKDSQLDRANTELERLTEERLKLQRDVLELSRLHDTSAEQSAFLNGQVCEKDKLISAKQDEVLELHEFLRTTSVKESLARKRLEEYIESLLNRTEKAEKRLMRHEPSPSRSLNFDQQASQFPSPLDDRSSLSGTWHGDSSMMCDTIRDVTNPPYTSTPHHRLPTSHSTHDDTGTQYPTTSHLATNQSTPQRSHDMSQPIRLQQQSHVYQTPHNVNNHSLEDPLSRVQRDVSNVASPSGFSGLSIGEVTRTPDRKQRAVRVERVMSMRSVEEEAIVPRKSDKKQASGYTDASGAQNPSGVSQLNAPVVQSSSGVSQLNSPVVQSSSDVPQLNLVQYASSVSQLNAPVLQSPHSVSILNPPIVRSPSGDSQPIAPIVRSPSDDTQQTAPIVRSPSGDPQHNVPVVQSPSGVSNQNEPVRGAPVMQTNAIASRKNAPAGSESSCCQMCGAKAQGDISQKEVKTPFARYAESGLSLDKDEYKHTSSGHSNTSSSKRSEKAKWRKRRKGRKRSRSRRRSKSPRRRRSPKRERSERPKSSNTEKTPEKLKSSKSGKSEESKLKSSKSQETRKTSKRSSSRKSSQSESEESVDSETDSGGSTLSRSTEEELSETLTQVSSDASLRKMKIKRMRSNGSVVEKQNKLDFITKRQYNMLFCVFMYLDVKTLTQMSLVCKTWRTVSRDPALWRRLVLKNYKISSKFLNSLSSWCTQVVSLTLEGVKPRSMLSGEKKQDYERCIRGCLEEGLESLLRVNRDSLVTLRIVDCGELLTDRCLWLASCYCRHLERVAYLSDTDPAGIEVIYSLGAGCRNISTLILPPMFPNQKPHKFTNRSVQMVSRCWSSLKVVCIGGIDVDMRGLTALAKNCQSLQVLELDHMCEITENTAYEMCGVGLRDLAVLDFTFTPVTPKALVHFRTMCRWLHMINIHIGISDYYEDTMSTENVEAYANIIAKLKGLRGKSEYEGVLHVKSDYG